MVETLPLCGLRYRNHFRDGSVFAPPFDVISPTEQRQLLARSPYNVVRLILGPDPTDKTWHAAAAATMAQWVAEGVLARDEKAAFYGYEQHFSLPPSTGNPRAFVRRGFIGRVRIAPWGQGIHPHERTRLAPREDRLRLMRAVRANLSPVFGIYSDPQGTLRPHLAPPAQPPIDYTDDEGVRQICWPINDPAEVAALSSGMQARDIVVADGHHRYETALAYRAERRAADGDPAEAQPYDYVLMYLTAAEDEGLCIIPAHRVISGAPMVDGGQLLARLDAAFERTPLPAGKSLVAAIAEAGRGGVALGACVRGAGRWVLRLKDLELARRAGADAPLLAEIDVNVLQNLIVAPHLGISTAQLATSERVSYTIDAEVACQQVERGEAEAAFILNPTSIEQVYRAARAGLVMPQKSTYFYPKPLTGLAFNPLD